jgi:predicted thioesterase
MKHLSSSELLSRTKQLAADERRATLALIEHLAEIQRRMLYAEIGYASLWEYVTKELGLSEGSAQRRIQAMKLLRVVPEARESLESGELSLSNAAKVQSFLKNEKKAGRNQNASAVVAQVKSQSQRECEATLFGISPEAEKDAKTQESDRIVSKEEDRLLKLTMSPVLYEKIQRLKGLLAHSMPDATYAELLEYMTNEALAKLEKKRGLDQNSETAITAAAAVIHKKPLPPGKRVYLPTALKKAVWARGGGQCEVTNLGKRCTSRHQLEIDHIRALALGGANDLGNLRLACWHHNQALALKIHSDKTGALFE